MIKQVFFTANHTEDDDRNSIFTYNSFQYDVQTKELKFVDQFNGQRFERNFGTASLVEDNTSGIVSGNTNTDNSGTDTNTTTDNNGTDTNDNENNNTTNNENESGS